MAGCLVKQVEEEITSFARQCSVEQVILFGSRARGDYRPRSDIDLAVRGGDITAFALGIDDAVQTLLLFDIVDLEKPVQPALLDEIQRDGVILYEKI